MAKSNFGKNDHLKEYADGMQSAYEIAETRKREKLIRVGRVVCAA